MCADSVVVTSPDAAIAVLQPTLTDAIAASQLYAAQVAAAQAIVLAAEANINNSLTLVLSSAAAAQLAASIAAAGSPVTSVSALPPGIAGARAYATNGRKIGETPGGGTGVHVYFSGGVWRCISTDAPVQS